MKRFAAIVLLAALAASACSDDRIVLRRGPLGPANYRVTVKAAGQGTTSTEHREATMSVVPTTGGASFTLQTASREVIQAQLQRRADGSLVLTDVRGASVGNPGQTELASLVGQLDPPLPNARVRIGDPWSSTRKITTGSLEATLQTNLRIVRYKRIAGIDVASLEGVVRGRLQATSLTGVRIGTISGTTHIDWAVDAGRVVAADTQLIWTLDAGGRIVLETRVRPV